MPTRSRPVPPRFRRPCRPRSAPRQRSHCSPITDPGTFSAIILNRLVPRLADSEPGSTTWVVEQFAARIGPKIGRPSSCIRSAAPLISWRRQRSPCPRHPRSSKIAASRMAPHKGRPWNFGNCRILDDVPQGAHDGRFRRVRLLPRHRLYSGPGGVRPRQAPVASGFRRSQSRHSFSPRSTFIPTKSPVGLVSRRFAAD